MDVIFHCDGCVMMRGGVESLGIEDVLFENGSLKELVGVSTL